MKKLQNSRRELREESFDAAASRRVEEKSDALEEMELAKEGDQTSKILPRKIVAILILILALIAIAWLFIPSAKAGEIQKNGAVSEAASPQKVIYRLGLQPNTYATKGALRATEEHNRFTRLDKKTIKTMEQQNIADVSLEGAKVKNSDLKKLARLDSLYMLDLQDSTGYSPKALRAFKNTSLKRLYLDGAGITDKWIPTIIELPVEFLSVMGNNLSDESIEKLSKNSTLRYLKFEADNSKKIQDAFRTGHWMRLPEGTVRGFHYYRNENPPPPQQ